MAFVSLLVISLLVNVLFVSAAPTVKLIGKHTTTVVSYFALPSGVPIIDVIVGDQYKGRFLFDTGASASCISDSLVKRLGLTTQPARNGATGGLLLGGQLAQMAYVPKLQIGGFSIVDSPFVILSQKALAAQVGANIDGIVGSSALTAFLAMIDFQKQQITLITEGDVTSEDLHSLGMSESIIIPVHDLSNYEFSCHVTLTNSINHLDEDLLIDTGDVDTFLSYETVQKLGLSRTLGEAQYHTIFGNVSVGKVTIPSLFLGSFPTDDVPAMFFTKTAYASFPPHLGLNVLSRYRILFDYGHKQMYIKPNFSSVPMIRILPSFPPASQLPKQPWSEHQPNMPQFTENFTQTVTR